MCAVSNSRLALIVSAVSAMLSIHLPPFVDFVKIRLTSTTTDLSAGVDVYSDWIDACDSVAKEAADAADADDGFNSYQDLAAGNERRNSEMNIDRHLVAAVGGNENGGDVIDDD